MTRQNVLFQIKCFTLNKKKASLNNKKALGIFTSHTSSFSPSILFVVSCQAP